MTLKEVKLLKYKKYTKKIWRGVFKSKKIIEGSYHRFDTVYSENI